MSTAEKVMWFSITLSLGSLFYSLMLLSTGPVYVPYSPEPLTVEEYRNTDPNPLVGPLGPSGTPTDDCTKEENSD